MDYSIAPVQPPQIQGPAQWQQQVGAGQNSMVQAAQQIRQFQSQNAMRGVLSQPDAIGPDGQPSANAMKQIYAIDPGIGAQLQQQSLKTQGVKADLYKQKHDMVSQEMTPIVEQYEDDLKKGLPPAAATANAQKSYSAALTGFANSGNFTPDEVKSMPINFDYGRAKGRLETLQQHERMQVEQQRAATTESHVRTEEQQRDQQLQIERDRVQAATAATTPAKAAERDAETIADDKIKQEETKRGAPLSEAEKAGIRQTSRIAPKVELHNAEQPGVISDEAANLAADRLLAGDERATTGMARSGQNITKVTNAIAARAAAQGMGGADIARKVAEFAGAMAGERTLATRSANMEIAANEVKNMAPLALSASEKVDRTKYPALNGIIQAAEKGTGDEEIVRFGLAANSLIYTYSKFLNPTGIPTDADKAKATEILSTAWSKGQFSAAVDQIKKEIASGQSALGSTRENLGDTLTGKKPTETAAGDKPVARPASLAKIPGLQWNKDRTKFRDPATGKTYDKDGKPL